MELVHGVPITKYCDDNRLMPRQRLELFVPVCRAIQHAHQKGIIHRDIKPSNVMITLYDGKAVPKVIDFGVAKATEQKLTEQSLFTQYGTLVGTLEYMSPEQAELSALGVDTRSDIYSLGVLLYELLTGSTPLSPKRIREAAYAEILRIIKEEEPPRPSTRLSDSGEALASISARRDTEPAKLTKLMRGELDWIVMKTLEKDRNRRYESASGLARDVERYLNDEPVQACPPSAWYRFGKFARRNRGRMAVAAGVFLAVIVMAASIGWAVRDRLARAADVERGEIARLANVEGQVRDSWNTARALIADNKLASAHQKLAEARAQLGKDRSVLVNLAAEVEDCAAELDRWQQFLDLIDRAHQAETAAVLEPALAGDGSPGRAGTPTLMGLGERRPGAAVPFLLEVLECYEILERDDWNIALEGSHLGRDQVGQIRRRAYEELLWLADDVVRRQEEHRSGRKLSPEAAARQSLVYLDKAGSAHPPTHALYVLRAGYRKTVGQEAESEADRQRAVKTPPTMAVDHYLLGWAAYGDKRLADGVEAFEAALRLEPTHYWSKMRLGYCLLNLAQKPEEFTAPARVFTGCILKRPDHAYAYCCRGMAYHKLRRHKEAVADYSRAIELDGNIALAWSGRGYACSFLGQPQKAVADCSRAIELDPKLARLWSHRGDVYVKAGQYEKAVADYCKAVELGIPEQIISAWRGEAFGMVGQYGNAAVDFARAVQGNPTTRASGAATPWRSSARTT